MEILVEPTYRKFSIAVWKNYAMPTAKVLADEGFQKEYDALLKDYVGRPSPLYLAQRLSEKYGCKIYLKRRT